MRTRRRAFLATCGAVLGGTAGCLGDGGTEGSSTPADVEDENPDDGYAPESFVPEESPDAVDFDPSSFDTVETYGIQVPLVPADVAYNWFQRREARFADARYVKQYTTSHVVGAVLSPAPNGSIPENAESGFERDGDPVADWPEGDRIVTYCGCPHHLSSQRAATLLDSGYESVYAIDEGFFEGWQNQDRPTTGGGGGTTQAQIYEVRGETAPADAGQYARVVDADRTQQEAAPIDDDGSYRMELHFSDLSEDSLLTVQTPSYEVTRTLAQVTEGVVTGE